MASSINSDQALQVINKANSTVKTDSAEKHPVLHKDYFSLETGEPIPFDQITKRIRKRFADIDKASVGAMLDLFVLHQQWSNFYKREDSFSKYLKDDLQISRTHAYGVINSVKLLTDYFAFKGDSAPELGAFLGDVSTTMENIGVKRLILIAGIREEGKKFDLVEKLLSGERISADDIESKIERKPRNNIKISLDAKDLVFDGSVLLRFEEGTNDEFRQAIVKAVIKFYKKLKP